MKIENIFNINEKTIFTGELNTELGVIKDVQSLIIINGKEYAKIHINGEVSNGVGHRDLWTSSPICLSHSDIENNDIIIKSQD